MIKCELVMDGYSYRVTDDVMNWDDIVVSVKRGDYDGVVRSFTSKFEFVNVAHALLKKQYRDNYLRAAASVVMSRRNNSWGWNELFRCTLDFSTYEDSGNVISINAVDDSLASLIKAKKGTQYEYSVEEIKEYWPLYYDRLAISNYMKYAFGGTTNDDGSQYIEIAAGTHQLYYYSIPAFTTEENEVLPNASVELLDIPLNRYNTPEEVPAFIKANRYLKLKISISFEFLASIREVSVSLRNEDTSWFRRWDNSYHITGEITKVEFSGEIELRNGEGLKFSIFDRAGDGGSALNKVIFKNFSLNIEWMNSGDPVFIDIVKPAIVLNRLLKSINGGNEGLTGEIESSGNYRLENCMIVAAESIRGIKGAKLYSSFSKFSDWMKTVFGYVYDISGDKVTFRHRTKYFTNEVVKEVQEFDVFSHSVNASLIYSRVRVGYDKQDYDSINGRDEFHFTNEFTTGITLTDNALELISPFRADPYGIEFLAQRRGEDTTDSESDNDVFFVCAKNSSITINPGPPSISMVVYVLIRDWYEISGVISPDTMFNAMYSPRSMLLANKGFIGCCTDNLVYASGEGNSDVVIDGSGEKDDVLISLDERISTVGELSFATPEFEIPDNHIGLVSLIKNGEKYLGYILKADMNTGRETCTKFSLSIKNIQ